MAVSRKTAARSAGGATRATASTRSGPVAAQAAVSAPSERPTRTTVPGSSPARRRQPRTSRIAEPSTSRVRSRSGPSAPSPPRSPGGVRSRWSGGTGIRTSKPAAVSDRTQPRRTTGDRIFQGGTRTAVPRRSPRAGVVRTGGRGSGGPEGSRGRSGPGRQGTAGREARSSTAMASRSTSRWKAPPPPCVPVPSGTARCYDAPGRCTRPARGRTQDGFARRGRGG